VTAGKLARVSLAVPPGDRKVTWDPGDGTPHVAGAELAHAWQRPGRYTVTVDVDGNRDAFAVEVVPRPVLDAVPGAAKLALVVPRPWELLPRISRMADRLSLPVELRRGLRLAQEKVGLQDGKAGSVEAAGLDPQEGVALVVLPEDPEGIWVLAGILDEPKALALGRDLTALKDTPVREMETARFAVGDDEDGNAVAYGVAGGYLAVRLPGNGDPRQLAAAAVHLALAPEGTLGADPEFQRARAMAPGEDALFFAQPRSMQALAFAAGQGADSELVGALAIGITLGENELDLTAGVPLERETAAELLRTFRASRAPAAHAMEAPAGAVGFLSLSLSPQRLLGTVFPRPEQRFAAEAAAMEAFGVRLTDTVATLSGNLALAVYLDPEGMLTSAVSAARGEPAITASNTPPALLLIELAAPDDARAAMGPALERVGAEKSRGGQRFTLDSGTAEFAGNTLRIASASARPLLDRGPGGPPLAEAIGQDVLGLPGQQVLYVDVAAIVDGLAAAHPRGTEQLAAQAMLRARLDMLAPLRDVLLHGGATAGGIEARLRLRLRDAAPVVSGH
jgi:hypothetical protein